MIKNFDMRFFIILFLIQLFSFAYADCYNLKIDFFKNFNDEYLEKYIEEALNKNHDLKSINHKVKQFRYEVHNSIANELPRLSIGAKYLGSKFPKGDDNFLIKNNSFISPIIANYEIDLLLKNRDKSKSKKKLYEAELAKEKASYLSLLGEVYSGYLNIMLFDYLIEKQLKIVQNIGLNVVYNREKFQYGVLDFVSLTKEYETLEIQEVIYNTFIKSREKMLYNFATLIGISPNCINEIKRSDLDTFEYKNKIPTEISSEIISNRPDLIELENRLKSSKIDIRVAKKEFFPTFDIIGAYILDTASRGSFFSWNSSFAFLIAGLTQDLFAGGRKIANLKIKKEKFLELMEKYKQADLIAIKEINSALFSINEDTKSEKSLTKQVNYEKVKFNSSKEKYSYGTISKIDLINDENSLLQQKQLWANSKATRLMDYINLYKAIGGEI